MRLIKLYFIISLIPTISSAQSNLQKAEELIVADSLDEAIDILIPVEKHNLVDRAHALRLLGSAYVELRDIQSAIANYQKLLDYSRHYNSSIEEIESLYWLTRLNAISGDFEKALEYGNQGSQLAQLQGEESWEFRINNFLSWAYFEQQIDFNKVLLHEKRQTELVNKLGNEKQKAQVYNNLGYDLTVAGIVPLDSAIRLMSYANTVYGEDEKNQGRWYTLMNLTWQHRLKGEFEKAIAYGRSSLSQAQADEDRHAIIEASFQLGESLMAAGKRKEAKEIYEIGLRQSELKIDRDKYVFDVYYSRYLWETNEKKVAVEGLEKAISFLTNSEVFYEMHGRALLADYYFDFGRIKEAQKQLEVLADPRHNYIAIETKFLAAATRANIWEKEGKAEEAQLLRDNWHRELSRVGFYQYTDF